MTRTRKITRSLSGGEITPEMFGRTDDKGVQAGLEVCRNFIVLPHGPVVNRSGTRFVKEVKDSTKAVRLIPYTYSTTQTFVLEIGDQYLRFHTSGATLLAGSVTAYSGATAYTVGDLASSGGVNYYCIAATTGNAPPNATYWYAMPADGTFEIPTPYLEADLFDIHFVQSNDVLTLTHPNYAPRELRRYGATDWVLATISFVSELNAPTGVSATATTGSGSTTYSYKVTAVGSTGLEESLPSSAASCTNNLLTGGNKNTISWSAVSGASRYNVYLQDNGLYGFIGQTDTTSFVDDNIAADLGKTPPISNNPFPGSGDYPGAVTYYEQRRVFAGTNNSPQNFWMTRSGAESNFAYSIPTRDDDSIRFRIAAREANRILHAVPLTNLIFLTSSAEWRLTSINSDAVTPTSTSIKPQSYVGSSNVQPVIINNNIIFAAARGGHLRELAYSFNANGYITGDICLRCPHLFDGFEIIDLSYAKEPQPVVWATSTSKNLIGTTYVPEQQVGGMHRHDTYTLAGQSVFESNCVVQEGADDALYVVVRRVINSNSVRYIERFARRRFDAPEDAFFVDCGLTYDGAPTNTLSGLDHLEGETVNVLADGAVHPQRTVASGSITLDVDASVVQVGLPITADLRTPPLIVDREAADGYGMYKNVNKIWLRVYQSGGIFAGPDTTKLTEYKQRTNEVYGSPPDLKSEEIQITLTPTWAASGAVSIRQTAPLPLTVCSITAEVELGG